MKKGLFSIKKTNKKFKAAIDKKMVLLAASQRRVQCRRSSLGAEE